MTCDPLSKKDDDVKLSGEEKNMDQSGNSLGGTEENTVSFASRIIIHPNDILGIELAHYIPIGVNK